MCGHTNPAHDMLRLHEVRTCGTPTHFASIGLYRINYDTLNGNLKAKAHRDLGRDGFTNDHRHYHVTNREDSGPVEISEAVIRTYATG